MTAFCSPTRQSWSPKATVGFSANPLASVNLHKQQFGPFEATLPIVGETRKDALMIAELVLRGHEPPEISTQPATEPPPHAKFAMRRSIDPTRGQPRPPPAGRHESLPAGGSSRRLKLRINFLEGENSTLLSAATACTCARTSSYDGTPQERDIRTSRSAEGRSGITERSNSALCNSFLEVSRTPPPCRQSFEARSSAAAQRS